MCCLSRHIAEQCPVCGSVGRAVHWGNRYSDGVILSNTCLKYHGDGGQELHAPWTEYLFGDKCCVSAGEAGGIRDRRAI